MWYYKIAADLSKLPDFIEYYTAQYKQHKNSVSIKGNIERNLAALPGVTETVFYELQEIEAVLNFLNIQLKKIRRKFFQKYLEAYNRELSSRDAEKYADGESEVVEYELLINEVALLRNQYLGIMKGLEAKGFQLNSITKLRVVGMEDASLS